MSFHNAHGYEREYHHFRYTHTTELPAVLWRSDAHDLPEPKDCLNYAVTFVRDGARLSELSADQVENVVFGDPYRVVFTKE